MGELDLGEFQELTEVSELKGVISTLQGQLRKSKAKTEDLIKAVESAARDAYIALGKVKAVPPAPTSAIKRGAKPEIALLHLSDWQVGKVTESYNTEIAIGRVKQLGEIVERIANIERGGHPLEECHALFGGDFVEGAQIFPGQVYEIDSTLFQQQATASRMSVDLVRKLCSIFKKVHVWEEDGNHGRIGRRGDYSKDSNIDLLTYHIARLQLVDLENEGRLVWHVKQGWYSIVEIGNYRALLVHGDEIKSFGGQTPAFGITRKVAAWSAGVVPEFHDCYMGHWHQPLVLPLPQGHRRTFVNPSIESDNTYAQEFVGASGAPGQRLNLIEPVKGRVTSERVIWLD